MSNDGFDQIRLQCHHCGRFLAESRIHEEDYRDDGAYYGISTRTWVDCPRCGREEVDMPRFVIFTHAPRKDQPNDCRRQALRHHHT